MYLKNLVEKEAEIENLRKKMEPHAGVVIALPAQQTERSVVDVHPAVEQES